MLLETLRRETMRKLAHWTGQAYWYPDLQATCASQGLTLIPDKYWSGLAGERRTGIKELPGHVLILSPGPVRMCLTLACVPTVGTMLSSTLEHTSAPAQLAKTGLGFNWLWWGYPIAGFIKAVQLQIKNQEGA
jgi:hypothetical protein